MSNKKVHASTGKRKSTVKTEQDSIVKLEHTFGDDGSLSMGMLNNADDSLQYLRSAILENFWILFQTIQGLTV